MVFLPPCLPVREQLQTPSLGLELTGPCAGVGAIPAGTWWSSGVPLDPARPVPTHVSDMPVLWQKH